MTRAVEILAELHSRGVAIQAEEEMLFLKPKIALDEELLGRIRERKREILAALAPTAKPAECKHCEGRGECDCPACTLRRTEKAVPCLMCHPVERQAWLAATRPEGCWHCGGSGKCGCIACDRPGVCTVCAGPRNRRAQ